MSAEAEEIEQAAKDYDEWAEMEATQEQICQEIGIEDGGAVDPKLYNRAIKANVKVCSAWIATLNKEQLKGVDVADIWPYKLPVQEIHTNI